MQGGAGVGYCLIQMCLEVCQSYAALYVFAVHLHSRRWPGVTLLHAASLRHTSTTQPLLHGAGMMMVLIIKCLWTQHPHAAY
jgi:hypothetical protein